MKNETFHQQILQKAPFGYAHHEIILDEKGKPIDYRFLEVNEAFEKLTGLRKNQLIGYTVREAIPGIEKSAFNWIDFYGKIALEGGETSFNQFSEPLGRWYNVKVYSTEKMYFTTVFTDFTDQKLKEEALRQSEERFRIAQEMSPDGFTILHPVRNEEGEIVDFTWIYENQTIARINGTDPQKVIGKRLLELFPTHRGKEVFEAYLQVANTGKSMVIENVYLGQIISSPTWFRLVIVSMGEDIAILSQDITERKQTEEAEAKQKNIMSQAEELANLGSWEWDIKNDVWVLSANWKRIHGVADIQLTTQQLLPIAHPEDRPAIEEAFTRAVESGEPYDIEHRIIRQDTGEIRFVSAKGLTLCDTVGKPEFLVGTAQDITGHKKNEEALRESEVKFRSLFNQSTEGIYLHDLEGRILDVNEMACTQSGYSREEWLSRTIFDGLPDENTSNLPKEAILRLWTDWRPGQKYTVQVEHQRKDGTVYPVEISTGIVRLKDENFIMAIVKDITERIQAEAVLRSNYDLLKIAGETALFGGWSVDLEKNICIWSDAVAEIHEMPHGYAPPVEEGISFYAPEWRDKITQVFNNCAQKGIPYDEEMEIITKKGRRLWVRTIGRAVKDENGTISKVHGSFQDITKSKQVEEENRKREIILNKVFEVLPIGLWFADKNGKLLRGNPAGVKIWGAEPKVPYEEYGVFKARRLPSGEEVQSHDWALAHTIKRKVTIADELLEIDTFDGKKKTILNYTAPLLDDNGDVLGAIVVNNDITERKKAEDELRIRIDELERFHNITVGRELNMIELKKEVNELLEKLGHEKKYKIVSNE